MRDLFEIFLPTKTASPLRFWTPHWPGAGLHPAPGENLVARFFFENQPNEICRHLSEKASKGRLLMPKSSKITVTKEN